MPAVDRYLFPPFVCITCGSPHLPAFDFGRDVEARLADGGDPPVDRITDVRLVLCHLCVGGAAETFGWITPERADAFHLAASAAVERAHEAEERAERAEQMLAAAKMLLTEGELSRLLERQDADNAESAEVDAVRDAAGNPMVESCRLIGHPKGPHRCVKLLDDADPTLQRLKT